MMMTLVWNLEYWQDSMLSCAVAYWKCEAGDSCPYGSDYWNHESEWDCQGIKNNQR